MSNETVTEAAAFDLSIYFRVNGVVALTEFTVGASLNAACFFYFLQRSLKMGTNAVNSLFLAISFVDICLCSNMLFSAISALNDGAAMCFKSKFLCNLWGLVWHTGQGLSVFLVALLAFARWRCMVKPLKTIERRTVLIAIATYTTFQIFKSTLNYWYVRKDYQYSSMFLGCTVSNIDIGRLATIDKVVYFFLYICEIMVPAIPIIAFSLLTMFCLKRRCRSLSALKQDKMLRAKKREGAITMLVLVAAYLFFNVFYWCFLVGDALYVFSEGRIQYHTAIWGTTEDGQVNLTYSMTYYMVYIHAVVLNSTTNALIYFIRLAGLRETVKYQLTGFGGRVKRMSQVSKEYKKVNSFTQFDQLQSSQRALSYRASRESQMV